MKINDIINEDAQSDKYVQQFQKKKIERELRQLAGKLKSALQSVSIQFAGHFADRMIDGRNDPMITLDELETFVKKIDRSDDIQQKLAKAGEDGLQAVVHELKSKINIPFMIQLLPDGPDANNIPDLKLVPKTIMRKANFGTSGPKINMEGTRKKTFESGSMDGAGPIAREEIEPTIRAIEKELDIDLVDVTLGSAGRNKAGSLGKKQFSGDIDAAVNIDPADKESFEQKLKNSSLILDYRMGSTVSTKVKIVNYDANREFADGTKPDGRTGYVQFDFMPGNPAAKKAFYHSPEEGTSQYKGSYRTELLMIVAAMYNQNNSEEKLSDGRPLESERWVFSPDHALVRVLRKPKMGKNGYTKANTQEVIGEPITDPDAIAKTLGFNSGDDIDSFESLWAAVLANRTEAEVEAIRQAALKNRIIGTGEVPRELTEWLPAVAAIARGVGTAASNVGKWAMRNPTTAAVVGSGLMTRDSGETNT